MAIDTRTHWRLGSLAQDTRTTCWPRIRTGYRLCVGLRRACSHVYQTRIPHDNIALLHIHAFLCTSSSFESRYIVRLQCIKITRHFRIANTQIPKMTMGTREACEARAIVYIIIQRHRHLQIFQSLVPDACGRGLVHMPPRSRRDKLLPLGVRQLECKSIIRNDIGPPCLVENTSSGPPVNLSPRTLGCLPRAEPFEEPPTRSCGPPLFPTVRVTSLHSTSGDFFEPSPYISQGVVANTRFESRFDDSVALSRNALNGNLFDVS
jgi:hypothetical protein